MSAMVKFSLKSRERKQILRRRHRSRIMTIFEQPSRRILSVKNFICVTVVVVVVLFFNLAFESSTVANKKQESVRGKELPPDHLQKSLDTTHPSYDVILKDVITEYGAYCTLYRHKKSGAELLSVAIDDNNKVFGITFRTPPDDSTGVAHILEHSVLCGSRKYKTKDPFVQLLQGSLQTFLNAMTFPDRTCYVVASQNLKDFYNLINVYTDAVFYPRAISDPKVLAQEGWHLELEKKEDPLTYKGVVYNEMKGVYSSADSMLSRISERSLFPNNTYVFDSGGNPRNIVDLSYESFVNFHNKFYHPANSRIYFSGNDDVKARLDLMDGYLKDFDDMPEAREKSRIEWQPKIFSEPKREVHPYPSGPDNSASHMINVNWLLNDKPMTDMEELTLIILDHLLLGTASSVLYRTLMESGLGEAITGGGLSGEMLQSSFLIGLKGVSAENVESVKNLIEGTFLKVSEEGFTESEIASSLNTIEFQLREFNTGNFPKGLSFMFSSMAKWIYGYSPTNTLRFEKPLKELKVKIAESGSRIFQDMIQNFFVNNQHRSIVQFVPSETLEEELQTEERERLEAIKTRLSTDEVDQVIDKTAELKQVQASEDSPEDRASIPRLELKDLTLKEMEYPISVTENEKNSGITVIRHVLGATSGIAYVNLGVDLSVLSLEDVPLIPLFSKILLESGAGDYDSVALSQRIGSHTGGIDIDIINTVVYPKGSNESKTTSGTYMATKLVIQGKATSDKINELFSIMKLILTDSRLDSKSKVIEMLKEMKSDLTSDIQSSGHRYINRRMMARYRVSGYIQEIMDGISSLGTLRALLKQAEEDWPGLLQRLENIRSNLLAAETCRSGMFLDLTGDEAVLKAIKPSINKFLIDLPGQSQGTKLPNIYKEIHPWVPAAQAKMTELTPLIDEGFVVSTQVSYVGKAGMLYGENEIVHGSTEVVARFLQTGYLWDNVRVIGGAYGAFCVFSPSSGLISLLSYRDPNLSNTINVYDATADALLKAADTLENDPEALATAIIGTIGARDDVLSPDQKGYVSLKRWLIRESSSYRQKFRDEILGTKVSDFRDFAERLKVLNKPSIAVVSSNGAFETAEKEGKNLNLQTLI